jgi:hypothetical protein
MPEAISDSSTRIHLAAIGRLDLLRAFYERVIIPPAVWIEVIAPSNEDFVLLLKRELHSGESESIALAIELRPDVVFLDEREARKVTKLYQLETTGVIGVLIRAKLEGKVDSLQLELDRLRTEAGFWIGDRAVRASPGVCWGGMVGAPLIGLASFGGAILPVIFADVRPRLRLVVGARSAYFRKRPSLALEAFHHFNIHHNLTTSDSSFEFFQIEDRADVPG